MWEGIHVVAAILQSAMVCRVGSLIRCHLNEDLKEVREGAVCLSLSRAEHSRLKQKPVQRP